MIQFKIISWWNLSRSLESFIKDKMDRKDYRDWVLDTMNDIKDKNFKSEWRDLKINRKRQPLSVSTSQARMKRTWYYKNQPRNPWILRWTGNLQENITREKKDLSCALIFNANYAIYHQDWQWSKHRTIFEFNNPVKAEIMRNIQTQFNKNIWIWNARKSS
jgi:phage gpG-like protein